MFICFLYNHWPNTYVSWAIDYFVKGAYTSRLRRSCSKCCTFENCLAWHFIQANTNDIFICSGAMNFLKACFIASYKSAKNYLKREPLLDFVVFFPVHFFLVPCSLKSHDPSCVDCCGHVSYYLSHNRWDLYYTWVKMSLQMRPMLPLGPNVHTDETFITLGFSYYTSAFYNLSKRINWL